MGRTWIVEWDNPELQHQPLRIYHWLTSNNLLYHLTWLSIWLSPFLVQDGHTHTKKKNLSLSSSSCYVGTFSIMVVKTKEHSLPCTAKQSWTFSPPPPPTGFLLHFDIRRHSPTTASQTLSNSNSVIFNQKSLKFRLWFHVSSLFEL